MLEIEDSDKLVIPENGIVYFSADWCAPCKVLKPLVKKVKDEGHNVLFVDVDKEPLMAEYYGITSVPTLVGVKDGKEVIRKVGVISEKELLEDLVKKTKDDWQKKNNII